MSVSGVAVIHNILRTRFDNAFKADFQIQYSNVKFTKPDNEMWVRWTITGGDSFLAEIGGNSNNRYRLTGVAIAQIFSPLETGDGDALELADRIENEFLNQIDSTTISGASVTLRTPYTTIVGRVGNEWQVNVNCPFYADKIK